MQDTAEQRCDIRWHEIEVAAMRGDDPPHGMCSFEIMYDLVMRNIYLLYKAGHITNQNAACQKQLAVKSLRMAMGRYSLERKLADHTVSM